MLNYYLPCAWRIIPFSKWLGSSPFISHGVRPFGRGPTTRSLGGQIRSPRLSATYPSPGMIGMILQAMPPQEITPYSGIMVANNPLIRPYFHLLPGMPICCRLTTSTSTSPHVVPPPPRHPSRHRPSSVAINLPKTPGRLDRWRTASKGSCAKIHEKSPLKIHMVQKNSRKVGVWGSPKKILYNIYIYIYLYIPFWRLWSPLVFFQPIMEYHGT